MTEPLAPDLIMRLKIMPFKVCGEAADALTTLQQTIARLTERAIDIQAEAYGRGQECAMADLKEAEQTVARLEKEKAITSLSVPLEEDLSGQIDEMLKYLAMEDGFTLAGIARLLIETQRRMADDWQQVGNERRLRQAAEQTVARSVFKCAICGQPATCFGAYEGRGELSGGCDACCGHGNEDGTCRPLAELPTKFAELEQTCETLRANLRSNGNETDECRQEIVSLRAECETIRAERDQLAKTVDQADEAVHNTEADLDAARAEIVEKQERITALEDFMNPQEVCDATAKLRAALNARER